MEATLSNYARKPRRNWNAVVREREALGLPKRKRGGQPGNINRMTHGRYSGYIRARRAITRQLVRETNALIARLKLEASLMRLAGKDPATMFMHPFFLTEEERTRGHADPSPSPQAETRFEYTLSQAKVQALLRKMQCRAKSQRVHSAPIHTGKREEGATNWRVQIRNDVAPTGL